MSESKMNPIDRLVSLRASEKAIKNEISELMPIAIEQALSLNKQGSLGVFNGAKVTLKLIKQRPKSNKIDQLEQLIKEEADKTIEENYEQIAYLVSAMEFLSQSIAGKEAEAELKIVISSLSGEVKPELSISFINVPF